MLSNLKRPLQLFATLRSMMPMLLAFSTISLPTAPMQAQSPEIDLLVHSDEMRLDGTIQSVEMSRQQFTLSIDMLLLRDDMSGELTSPAPRTIVALPNCRLLDVRRPTTSYFRFEQLTPGVEVQVVGRDTGDIIHARLIIVSGGNLRAIRLPATRQATRRGGTGHRPGAGPKTKTKNIAAKRPTPQHNTKPVLLSRSFATGRARRNGQLRSGVPKRMTSPAPSTAIAPTSQARSELPPQLQSVIVPKHTWAPRSLTPTATQENKRIDLPQSRVQIAVATQPRTLPPTLAIAPATTDRHPRSAAPAPANIAPMRNNTRPPDRLTVLDTAPRIAERPVETSAPAVAPSVTAPSVGAPAVTAPSSGDLVWDLAPRPLPQAQTTSRLAILPDTAVAPTAPPLTGERQVPQLDLPENSPFWNTARLRFDALSAAQQHIPFAYFSGGSQEHKLVALTFDDGPDLRHTPRVLDILKREGVPATFFVIGRNVEKHPEIVLRSVAEGHEIGNHTFQHRQGGHLSLQEWRDEINATNLAIMRLLGAAPRWFRAPGCRYSSATLQAIAEANMVRVDTTNNSSDWDKRSAQSIHDRIMSRLAPGDVLLFHDGMDQTSIALPRLIHEIRARGYRFVTLTELATQAQQTPGFQPVFRPEGQGIVISSE